jgi:hypothetical protein
MPTPSNPVSWRFAPQPVELTRDEFWERYSHDHMPEKFESTHGKLFWSDEQRYHVLAMLIEVLGTEAVQRFVERYATEKGE